MTASCSVLTPAGRGAVAVIQIVGPSHQLESAFAQCFVPAIPQAMASATIGRLIYGRWGHATSEDVVLCRTSDDTWEVQCHGGTAAVQQILTDLQSSGIEAHPSEPFRSPLSVLLQHELSRALTWRAADMINEQAGDLLQQTLTKLAGIPWSSETRDAAMIEITRLLEHESFALHLTTPWQVILIGRPNVGKSSVMNALLGYARSIVTPIPGTTRDVVSSMTAFDGWPVCLQDTAGLRTTSDPLEGTGMERGQAAAQRADLTILVLDGSTPPTADDEALLHSQPHGLTVINKSDLPQVWGERVPAEAIMISAQTGQGFTDLIAAIVSKLVPVVPAIGTPLPVSAAIVATLKQARTCLEEDDPQGYRATWASILSAPVRQETDLSAAKPVG